MDRADRSREGRGDGSDAHRNAWRGVDVNILRKGKSSSVADARNLRRLPRKTLGQDQRCLR